MSYQLPEPALPNCVIGKDSTMRQIRLDCYTADQMQAAWQAGRDSNDALLRMALQALDGPCPCCFTEGQIAQGEAWEALRERLGEKA